MTKIDRMTNETKHTPTPWHMQKDSVHVYGKDGGMVANTITACSGNNERENAAHIVKCVNMHDELVEALKQAYAVCKAHGYLDGGIEEALKKAGAL